MKTPKESIEWKVQSTNSKKKPPYNLYVPYMKARYVYDMMSQKYSAVSISTSFHDEKVSDKKKNPIMYFKTTISAYDKDLMVWNHRDGIGTLTDFESIKGGASDSVKRAGMTYGLGEDLANYPTIRVEGELAKNGRSVYDSIKKKDLFKFFDWLADNIDKIDVDDKDSILVTKNSASILNQYNNPEKVIWPPNKAGSKPPAKKPRKPTKVETKPTVAPFPNNTLAIVSSMSKISDKKVLTQIPDKIEEEGNGHLSRLNSKTIEKIVELWSVGPILRYYKDVIFLYLKTPKGEFHYQLFENDKTLPVKKINTVQDLIEVIK